MEPQENHRDGRKDETKKEKPARSSRLGKEAKIGVTVIVLLLVVLGGVIAMKLLGSSVSDDQLAATSGPRQTGGKSVDALFKDAGMKSPPPKAGATYVPVKAASDKSPKGAVSDLDRWKTPIDKKEAKQGPARASSPSEPPKFDFGPPEPPRAENRDRYASAPSAHGDGRKDREKSQEKDHGRDSGLGGRYKDVAASSPSRHPDAHTETKLLPPEADGADGGFASVEAAPTPPRDDSRFGDAPNTYRPAGSRDAPGRYGADDALVSRSAARDKPLRSMPTSYGMPARSDGKCEVQPNDSYWTISERLYGTGAYFKALAEHNRGKNAAGAEGQLKPGDLILAPQVADLEKSYPDLCPKPSRRESLQTQGRASVVSGQNKLRGGRTYTVAEGDTLFNIARYELGRASRWAEIYDLNRDVLGKDYNYLAPGTQLALPDGGRPDVLALPPEKGYRR
jgi:nucleoid-associated protein YgaU